MSFAAFLGLSVNITPARYPGCMGDERSSFAEELQGFNALEVAVHPVVIRRRCGVGQRKL